MRVLTLRPSDPEPHPGSAIAVRDGFIVWVGPTQDAPPARRSVEGGGRTVLPGLIDAHVHVWEETELAAYLAHGVTTVRNMSGMPMHLELAQRIASGELRGPRLLTTGLILNSPGPNQQINHQIVRDAAEARAAVAWQHARGFRHLKVYSNLSREAYEAVLDEARARGMTVCGHSPEGVRAEGVPFEAPFDIALDEVLDDGLVTLEHMETLVWHGLSDALDEEAVRGLARRIADTGVPVTPTLLAHHALLNPVLVAHEQEHYRAWAARDGDERRAHDALYARAVAIFHEESVPLVVGSDAGIFTNIPGSATTRELERLVAAGIPRVTRWAWRPPGPPRPSDSGTPSGR